MTAARYDGHADWYDDWRMPHVPGNGREVADLLGQGSGLCLDLGCGTGLFFDALAATGRTVVGLDLSADQLRHASRRSVRVVQADGAALPFADGTFSAVVAMWISTDVDDFPAVLSEIARVLATGGVFVFYGAHPCFNGRTWSGFLTAASGRTRLTASQAGTSPRPGGARTSARASA